MLPFSQYGNGEPVRIAVCVKQVPDTADVRIDPVTNTLIRDGVDAILNPYDAHAVEAAVALREKLGAGCVTVLTMGPSQSESVLRQALALGADEAQLLSDRAFAGADTWATGVVLAKALARIRPHLVFCGKQAIDGDTAQVGPSLAEHLEYSHASYVNRIRDVVMDGVSREDALPEEDATGGGWIIVDRLLDHGCETLEIRLPAVLTVVRELNEPRVPTLPGWLSARETEIPLRSAFDLGIEPQEVGLAGSPTEVDAIFSPPGRGGVEFLRGGSADETVSLLLRRMGLCAAEDRA